jgi:hypothetical protein
VRIWLQGPPAILAEEEPAARLQHFFHDGPEPLSPQPVACSDFALELDL